MTFFVRVYGEMSHVQCDDVIGAPPAIDSPCKLFCVSGDYISADKIIVGASFSDGVLTVPGREVFEVN